MSGRNISEGIIEEQIATKSCRDCKQPYPLSYYGRSRGYRDGRLSRCPPCVEIAESEAARRREEAPLMPDRYYVDTRGRMRCLACDGQAYSDEHGDAYCFSCGAFLSPPRRRVPLGATR